MSDYFLIALVASAYTTFKMVLIAGCGFLFVKYKVNIL